MALIEYAIDVLESIAATVDGGVYNIISHTPINPLALDQTAQALLEQQCGTALEPLVNDLGETIGYVAKGVANAGNGAASEVSTYVNVLTQETIVDAEMAAGTYIDAATGETAALTVGETVTEVSAGSSGAGLLAMDVGAAGPAIAVALGIVSGFALYNIAPSFWDGVAARLMEAGELVNGKVTAIFDTNAGTSFSENTIEIFKNAFLEAGFFDQGFSVPKITGDVTILDNTVQKAVDTTEYNNTTYYPCYLKNNDNSEPSNLVIIDRLDVLDQSGSVLASTPIGKGIASVKVRDANRIALTWGTYIPEILYETYYGTEKSLWLMEGEAASITGVFDSFCHKLQFNEVTKYAIIYNTIYTQTDLEYDYYNQFASDSTADVPELEAALLYATVSGDHTQEDATLPDDQPFPSTFPTWHSNHTQGGKDYYPVSIPTDDLTQNPAQSGDNNPGIQINKITDIIFNPDPIPTPEPQPDPDPQPEPEPEPEPTEPTPTDDPIDPNTEPEPSDPTPILPIVPTTSAQSLFCVYNPTDGQLNSLGAFLWTDNIIEIVKKIWQNPIEGVIALHKVYCPVTTSGSHNILLGYVDTEVSSAVVSSQFSTVDCGSILVSEDKHNATDYSPFTQLQLYLPFIGIQELDASEIMGGRLHVVYKVDVYTGTCLALVYCQRSPDMGAEQLLYTFSGNASQKLPLTSSDFGGAISALLGIVGVGVASGGALGAAAALGAAHSLTQEMVHIQHSGGLSANSGIMGPRKPYLIISRQHPYDANGYNGIYGYPANKTVYLSNCTGYTRIKSVNYRGDGTEAEKQEIVSLLKEGVIL